jgi:hypothetical protein
LPAVWAQAGAVRARVTERVDPENRITLRGNVHPLARPEFDQGRAPDDLALHRILLVLQRGADQEAVLRQLLDDQQVKSAPLFHQWLTPEQFGQQFGPADSDIQAVTDWLASQGFEVTKVSAGRTVIELSGTAGLVRQALGTEIHKFRVNGADHWANANDPQIPAALAPVVAGFASLNNFPRTPMYHSLGTFSRSKATGEVQPLFTFPITCSGGGSGCYFLALGPADFATIYNVSPLWTAGTDGTGQTIAVVGETNIDPQDVADFRSMFNLSAKAPNIILNGPDPGIIGDQPEADLDVQWSGAVAKGAQIDLVVSESTETTAGIDLSAVYIIDNNLAPVMSESYGSCEAALGAAGNAFYSTLWEQAAAQGITVLLAAGDSGSAGCDAANAGETAAQYGLAVSGLASTPFNVAVGGTDFNVTSGNALSFWSLTNTLPSEASAKSYIPETTWNDSCAASGALTACTPPPDSTLLDDGVYLLAGSGGPSSCTNPSGLFPTFSCSGGFAKPSWQSGTGVPRDSARDIPDVSMFAGEGFHYSFYVMCEMDANAAEGGSSTSCDLNAPYLDFQGGSGTSAAVQVFAGIMAMVNQRWGRQGNANYVLYPMAAKNGASCTSNTAAVTNSACVFYDVTVGNNSVICQGGSPNCGNTSAGSGQYGIMVSGGAAAYPTTAGYDLATGLGSVNVANLVNNWASNFTPSATTLSLSTSPATNPITLTHGQSVNFNINVTSGSATPSGDVSLIAQTGSSASNATGIGPFTLNGGSVAGSTNMLPGGSYNVTAHYAGDGIHAASDFSPGIPVVVTKESSLTEVRLVAFSASGPPVYTVTTLPYGSPYVLRMDVTNSSGQLCANPTTEVIAYPCPTGSLTVAPAPTDANPPAGTVPGSYTLNSQGYAEDQPIQQLPGVYNFVASYNGDNSYTASSSSPLAVTITKAATTITSCTLPSTTVSNTSLNCIITISTQSNGVAPTGTVQLLNNGASLGSPSYVAGTAYSASTGAYATAQVNYDYPLTQAGVFNLSFQYSGDSNYAGASTAPISVTVTNFTMSANPTSLTVSAGQSGSSTISLAPQNGFTGTVTLSVGGNCPTSATCTISPSSVTLNGTATATSTLTIKTTGSSGAPPGSHRKSPPGLRLPVEFIWLIAGLVLTTLLAGFMLRRRPAALFARFRPARAEVSSSSLVTCHSLLNAVWLRPRRAVVLVLATILIVAGVWVACGGGSGGGGGNPSPTLTPAVTLQYSSLTFSSQNIGSAAPSLSTQLSNTGNGTLTISSMTMGGANPGDFSQTNTCGTSVAAGANCTITVQFDPVAAGTRTATLTIADNAASSTQTISLSGTGVSQPTPTGTYPIEVLAASGQDSQNTTVNLTVQ